MVVRTAGGLPGVCPQDTYWCHTVSVFTAFSSNRIGEYDSPAVLTTASTVVLTGVPYTSELLEAVIILGQRTDREKTGQGVLRHQVSVFKTCRAETSLVAVCAVHSLLV